MRHLPSVLRPLLPIALVVAAACTRDGETNASDDALTTPAVVTDDELATLDHRSEGSDFFPYFVARALRVKSADGTLAPFLGAENLGSFGFIPDESARDGLPIGIGTATMPDTGLAGLGITCSACHTGLLEYASPAGGRGRVLVRGGAGLVSPELLVAGLLGGLKAELDGAIEPAAAFEARLAAEAAKELDGAEITLRRLAVFTAILALAQRPSAPEDLPRAIAAIAPDATQLEQRLVAARYHWYRSILTAPPGTRNGPGRQAALGIARNAWFYDIGAALPKTGPTNFPSIFYARDALHSHNGTMNSLLARNIAQSIVGGALLDWRGAAPTYASSVQVRNLVEIEDVIGKLRPPAWPADLPLDAAARTRGQGIYEAKCRTCHEPKRLENGLYEWNMFRQDEIGTDAENVRLQDERLPPPFSGEAAIEPIGRHIVNFEDVYFRTHADAQRDRWEDVMPAGRRPKVAFLALTSAPNGPNEGRVVAARPLDGVWATAPYLHNGSVPSLRALLTDEAARPKRFVLGHRLYDMNDLGFRFSEKPDPALGSTLPFVFEVETKAGEPIKGNGNHGHSGDRFGTTLSDDDKAALLEFLKGFGAGSERPVLL